MVRGVWLGGVAAIAALGAAIGLAALGSTGARADVPVMSIDPPSQNVETTTDPITVNVKLSGASNVSSFEFAIRYDDSLLDVADVAQGPFLASPDLHVQCDRSADTSHFGTNVVQYGCASTNTVGTYTGASGDGIVAKVTFHPKKKGVADLVFLKRELFDPAETSGLPVDSRDGVLNIVDPGQAGQALQPTPTPNPVLLTPTAVPPSEDDPYTLKPGSGGNGPQNPSGGASASGSSAPSGTPVGVTGPDTITTTVRNRVQQLPPGSTDPASASSASGGAAGARDQNFPHAGTGPEPSGLDPRWNYAIGLMFVGGVAFLAVGGKRRRIPGRRQA